MYRRNLFGPLCAALEDTPVVFLDGARQTGKSTLVRHVIDQGFEARYRTLDDSTVLAAASADPEAFLSAHAGRLVLDEVQRAPGLLLALKAQVDRDRRPGRFLLTGSADILLLPRVSDALVGRAEVLTLWPLSAGELRGAKDGFVDSVFGDLPAEVDESEGWRDALIDAVLAGGYPEVARRKVAGRRAAWYRSYVMTLLARDVRDLSAISGFTELPRLLSLLATQATGLLNTSDLARRSAIPSSTLGRYLTLLEASFLVQRLPAWSGNLGKRQVKSPKVFLNDSGLLGYLLGVDRRRFEREPSLLGPLLENFVVMELRKQLGWSQHRPAMYHFRTHAGDEVDIVLELPGGTLVGIEVKSATAVSSGDFKGLRTLAECAGGRFLRGLVLYTGNQRVSFAPGFDALPVSALWR